MFEYETISQKKKIENKEIATILDFLERYSKKIEFISEKTFKKNNKKEHIIFLEINKKYYLYISPERVHIVSKKVLKNKKEKEIIIFVSPLEYASKNIASIYHNILNK